MRFGLVAHRRHRQPRSGLARWVQACEPGLRALNLGLHAVGGTYDALQRDGLLQEYPALIRYPYGYEGGMMRLVSHLAGGLRTEDALDGVIYLIDPVDPTSIFPEALALKRECVAHGKPFVATVAGAKEWIAVELAHQAKLAAWPDAEQVLNDIETKTLALIAHDALKAQMVAFGGEHFDLLSRFVNRVATGTTGGLLNDLAWSKGWPKDKPWVTRYLSGPLGGDAQIAELVLEQRCHKVIFFEDPHVARQHEADIQLLERAVSSAGDIANCFNSPLMAEKWAGALKLLG